MKRSRTAKRGLLVSCAAVAAVLMGSCSSPGKDAGQSSAELQTIKIGIFPTTTASFIWAVAQERGLFEKYGLKADFVKVTSGPALTAGVMSGSFDAAMAPSSVVFQVINQGSKLEVLGNYAQRVDTVILQRKEDMNPGSTSTFPANIRELKGKKIGVSARGGIVEQFLLAAMRDAGMNATDVTLVASGPPATVTPMLKNRALDAIVADRSQRYQLQNAGVDVVQVADALNGSAGNAVKSAVTIFNIAAPGFKQSHPSEYSNYCKAISAALEWAQDSANRDAAAQILAEWVGLTVDQANQVWSEQSASFGPLTEKLWSGQPSWETGLESVPSYAQTVDNSCA